MRKTTKSPGEKIVKDISNLTEICRTGETAGHGGFG